jgi:hypothetical protein
MAAGVLAQIPSMFSLYPEWSKRYRESACGIVPASFSLSPTPPGSLREVAWFQTQKKLLHWQTHDSVAVQAVIAAEWRASRRFETQKGDSTAILGEPGNLVGIL